MKINKRKDLKMNKFEIYLLLLNKILYLCIRQIIWELFAIIKENNQTK